MPFTDPSNPSMHCTHIYSFNKVFGEPQLYDIAKRLNLTQYKILSWTIDPKKTKEYGVRGVVCIGTTTLKMVGGSGESFSQYYYLRDHRYKMDAEDTLVLQELVDLQDLLNKPQLQKELVGAFASKWKKFTFKDAEKYLPHLNYTQESNLDCGVACFITCLRILGLYKLKIVDIYYSFLMHMDVCVVDLAAELYKLGVKNFMVKSSTFEIEEALVSSVVKADYFAYLNNVKASIDQLNKSGNLIEEETSLDQIRDYLNSCIGFVIVLIDIEKIPNNGRQRTGTYQGHYIIVYKMDDANVSILDPSPNEEEKVHQLKIKDFENARLADGTDQSCIFVDCPQ